MIQRYPKSSYVPRALVTIGLIEYNAGNDDLAVESFKKVVQDYSSSDEAKLALKQIEKIYTDKGDAQRLLITQLPRRSATTPPPSRKTLCTLLPITCICGPTGKVRLAQ